MRYDKKTKELRAEILKMLYACQSGHPGGPLSCAEVLMALHYKVMKVDPRNPRGLDRDRSVLSKGHTCPALYAALADPGYSLKEDLTRLRQVDSHLQGHPDYAKTPGVDMNTGSLGRGTSLAMGLVLAAKYAKADYKVYTVLGDGECQEGLVWEAAMVAAHYKLDNLAFMLDHDKLQIDGRNDEVTSLGNIMKKFDTFGFECSEVDGHNMNAIVTALKAPVSGRSKFICCNTVKGKGVPFTEGQFGRHGSPVSKEQFKRALSEQEAE